MGAGKTTVGKEISLKLGIPFIDSDSEIEKMENKSINEIFEQNGEIYFRTLESHFIDQVAELSDFVLAVGGGLPCYNDLVASLNKLGTTVYLKCSVDTLLNRLKNEKELRPLVKNLNDEELKDYIEKLLNERDPVYAKAKYTLDEEIHFAETIIGLLPHQKN